MNILMTGSNGLVGSYLWPRFIANGHQVRRLVRREPASDNEYYWDPDTTLDATSLKGIDAVVHLAGETLAKGRWTAEKKAKIRDSRVKGTQLLCETIADLPNPPRILLCASATGYYGDRGQETLTEGSSPGTGFLPEVCREWEEATNIAKQKGLRVANLRFGLILSSRGGALKKMLTPFRMGLGGKVGSGTQYYSWIAIDDAAGAIDHILKQEVLQGPVNIVSPNPVTNSEFTKALGNVLQRPTILPIPAFAARTAFGEMADALLLASTRVHPEKLLSNSYVFRYPEIEGAFHQVIS
jgi:uncharacterized protein